MPEIELTSSKPDRCGDCDVTEGHYHEPGRERETCPFCRGQLFSCDCCYIQLGIDISPGTWAYSHGLTKAQGRKWDKVLRAKGLIPFFRFPILCSRCGQHQHWTDFFHVPDQLWQRIVPVDHHRDVICQRCFYVMKDLFEAAQLPT